MGSKEIVMASYGESIWTDCGNGGVCSICSLYEVLLVRLLKMLFEGVGGSCQHKCLFKLLYQFWRNTMAKF
jgi:hypothetical protein